MARTREAYEHLVQEDLRWLDQQPRSLEREHIRKILEQSVDLYFPPPAAPLPGQTPALTSSGPIDLDQRVTARRALRILGSMENIHPLALTAFHYQDGLLTFTLAPTTETPTSAAAPAGTGSAPPAPSTPAAAGSAATEHPGEVLRLEQPQNCPCGQKIPFTVSRGEFLPTWPLFPCPCGRTWRLTSPTDAVRETRPR